MKKKVIFVAILICVFYYLLSVFLSPSGSFIKNKFTTSNNQANKSLNHDLKVFKISDKGNCEKLNFWITENKYWKQFGLLPIGYYQTQNSSVSLHLEFPENSYNSNLKVKFSNYPEMDKNSIQSRIYNLKDTIDISVYNKTNIFCEMKILMVEVNNK